MAKFISLFAGVGGFDLGMEQAGHECVAQVEWDKNAAGVLKHRWPNVPLFCDVSKVSADDLPDADFITYGFPCQDLSVAGKREGLDGKRSGLFYEATRLIRELRSRGCGLRFAVAENVAGLFSADDGLALARCIRELLDCGACEPGWRLLDSQYFGVAQRRKRVFIVSDFGGESCDQILAITESLPGYPAPSREAGKGLAPTVTQGAPFSRTGNQRVEAEAIVAQCLTTRTGSAYDPTTETLPIAFSRNDNGTDATINLAPTMRVAGRAGGTLSIAFGAQNSANQGDSVSTEVTPTLDKSKTPAVAIGWSEELNALKDLQPTIQRGGAGGRHEGVMVPSSAVRRLTPTECERLQGFPDDFTQIPWRNKPAEDCPDGPRYKAMGNSMAVPVMRWIGEKIQMVESLDD